MQFIFGSELSAKVISLIEGSRKLLLLVSPYFDPWGHLATEIENATAVRKVNTRIVVRGGEDRARQEPATARFKTAGAQIHFLERLHAKLYMNEDEAILTSMNLLKSSAFGSWEIAVRLTRAEDGQEFTALGECVRKLLEHVKAEEERLRVISGERNFDPFMALGQSGGSLSIESSSRAASDRPTASTPAVSALPARPAPTTPAKGHCIRCSEDVSFAIAEPFCEKHARTWAKKADPDFVESYCHQCGERSKTTKRRPLCDTCLGAT